MRSAYPDRFTGLGKFTCEHKLVLKDNVQPKINPPRRAPIQLRTKIREELDRMKELDVIRPVSEPTEWVSSITYVKKQDGSLRICLDPKFLNEALRRGQHHIPTVEELTHQFAGSTVFSKLDAKSGYWSVPLDADSQLLTTFNSPFGRFCFKRLPFGLKTSQDVFQHAMDQLLDGLPGVISIADDIVVHGTSREDHDRNIHGLMNRAKERGLVFNFAKCKIKEDNIPFFGNIYSKSGVTPDPSKVQVISDLTVPNSVKELQSFLGMVTYLAPYIPNLSVHTAPRRQLLHKDSEFQWHPEHQQAFNVLKQLICSAGTSSYFDPSKPVLLQVDASQEALGAALLQEGRPIAYASKSLTDTEKRYANIERELLACVFGAERFHTYIFGKHFTIESDHRPLEMICKKNLTTAPARLQRMLLRLQKYDYDIHYKPGREMILPDSLSRLPKKKAKQDLEINLNMTVCFIQFASNKLKELHDVTRDDEELSLLMKYIIQGFPERHRDLHQMVRKFWSFRDELSIEDGLILKGEQVVIPLRLRCDYLKKVHEGHQGIVRCQERARSSIYWPGINKDIELLVNGCMQCQHFQPSQCREPIQAIMPNIPCIPWHTLGTDLFTYDGENFLIVADYHSKFPIVEPLGNCSTSNKVSVLTSKIFSMFGVPNCIISDNGPQFQGSAYQEMLQSYGVVHTTSSPHHSKSHGFIKRMIRTVKSLLKKLLRDTDKALLSFRTTPSAQHNPSPAELLFGRKIQSNLSIHTRGVQDDSYRQQQETRQAEVDQRYNNHSQELPELNINQPIFYQDVACKTWLPGIIIGYGPEPHSYTIQCSITSKFLRRNRVLLRPRHVTIGDDNPSVRNPSTILEELDNPVTTSSFSSQGENAVKPSQCSKLMTPESNLNQVVPNTPATPFIEKKVSQSGKHIPKTPATPFSENKVSRSGRQIKSTRRLLGEI